jgi:hypothetical protein
MKTLEALEFFKDLGDTEYDATGYIYYTTYQGENGVVKTPHAVKSVKLEQTNGHNYLRVFFTDGQVYGLYKYAPDHTLTSLKEIRQRKLKFINDDDNK